MNWQGKNVLVAGGAGMIGSAMARELLKRGAKVTVVDDLSSGSLQNIQDIEKDIEFFKYDLTNNIYCFQTMRDKDAVFQFAADMGGILVITTIGARIMFTNTAINMNMLSTAKLLRTPNYFFSSTACVYPNYKQVDENSDSINLKESDAVPADPNEFYGWEKLYAEKLVEASQRDYGMNIRVARFHNIFGEAYTAFDKFKGKAPCHLIMKTIKHPNPPMELWGDGKAVRSFLYIDDCIDGVLTLMDSDYKSPINIGSDRAVTVDQLADIIIKISGKKIVPTHDLTKPQGVRGRNSCNDLCEKVLHWRPKISLEDGLERVYKWAELNYDKLENI
jgi:GDP-D-mannose 3', 5'-epimerase